jgi:hypothetical protein
MSDKETLAMISLQILFYALVIIVIAFGAIVNVYQWAFLFEALLP